MVRLASPPFIVEAESVSIAEPSAPTAWQLRDLPRIEDRSSLGEIDYASRTPPFCLLRDPPAASGMRIAYCCPRVQRQPAFLRQLTRRSGLAAGRQATSPPSVPEDLETSRRHRAREHPTSWRRGTPGAAGGTAMRPRIGVPASTGRTAALRGLRSNRWFAPRPRDANDATALPPRPRGRQQRPVRTSRRASLEQCRHRWAT